MNGKLNHPTPVAAMVKSKFKSKFFGIGFLLRSKDAENLSKETIQMMAKASPS
jgi:hypothetical protein